MSSVPNVRLRLSSKPENVLLVRQSLRGLAEAITLDEVELNDVSTAVTEAANNVVSHAYGDGLGSLEVEIFGSADGLDVLVRDHGVGIGTLHDPEDEEAPGGIGLPVIRALAQTVAFSDVDGGGTEVTMHFAIAKAALLEQAIEPDRVEAVAHPLAEPEATVAISVAPPLLARAVLRRVLAALAVRAHFSSARVSETQMLADELVAHLAETLDRGRLSAGISVSPRHLELTVGPLRAGSHLDGLAALLERFSDGHEVEQTDSHEVLAVRLSEPAATR